MVGVAPTPAIPGIEALTQLYWSTCLQTHMEGIECGMTEGLELYDSTTQLEVAVKLDLSVLLRMDTATRYAAWKNGISGGWLAPNEARRRENMKPVKGGETPYLQQQNYSLAALAARDAAGPPSSGPTPPQALPAPVDDNANADDGDGKDLEDAQDAELDFAKGFESLRQRANALVSVLENR
jgi:phage portal protein BeeE